MSTVPGQVATERSGGHVIVAKRLTSGVFAPFGEVIEHVGDERRHSIAAAFDGDGQAPIRRLWVSRLATPASLPLRLAAMERHPHSAQFFVPLDTAGYLVAVCPALSDGDPDMAALQAFIAGPHQGVLYGCNVWHHPMVALDRTAFFVVSMAQGCADDDVFAGIDTPTIVVAPDGDAR